LIGRECELATLMERLRDPACRLISIVGPGGGGKSRLALEAAHRYAAPPYAGTGHPFPGGVFIADHAAAPGLEVRHTPPAIAQVLGLPGVGSGASSAQVATELQGQAWLLVLDNVSRSHNVCETLEKVHRQAPGVTVLLTAPEPLRLPGEWTQLLGGLELPASPADLERAPASRLFLQHAQRVRPSFTMAAADRDHVLHLCKLLHGLPGALVQAASWVRGMRCAEIVEELEHMPVPSFKRHRHAAEWPESPAGLALAPPSLLDADRHVVRQRLSAYHGDASRNEPPYSPFAESVARPPISV
jgi:predicted ATPase